MSKQRAAPLQKISDEMKVWSGMLAEEVLSWPKVSTNPMFGLTAMYRGSVVFAMLPKTRALGSPNAVAFKLVDSPAKVMTKMKRDSRIQETVLAAAKWFALEMESDEDLRGVLEWLGLAYEAAGKKGRSS